MEYPFGLYHGCLALSSRPPNKPPSNLGAGVTTLTFHSVVSALSSPFHVWNLI